MVILWLTAVCRIASGETGTVRNILREEMSQVLDSAGLSPPTARGNDDAAKRGGGDDGIAFYDGKNRVKQQPDALEQPIGGNGKYSEVPVEGRGEGGSPGKSSRPGTNQSGRR